MSGLHRKYNVTRTDGSSEPGRKHADCSYFVLDLEHDEYAIPALIAYADACERSLPDLARDLRAVANARRPECSCREASCPHSLGAALSGPSPTAERLMRKGAP